MLITLFLVKVNRRIKSFESYAFNWDSSQATTHVRRTISAVLSTNSSYTEEF